MAATDNEFAMVVEQALDNLRTQPKNLADAIAFVAEVNDIAIDRPLEQLVEYLRRAGPNDRVRHALISKLQRWDHEDGPFWSRKTDPHSEARRKDALRLLGFRPDAGAAINAAVPRFTESEVPIVIAVAHEHW